MKTKNIIFSKPYKNTLPIQVNVWIPKDYFDHIQLFLKKVSETIKNKNIKNKWETYRSCLFLQSTLGYKSNEEYLAINKSQIIENSIKFVLADINHEDLTFLVEKFVVFTHYNKIRIKNTLTKSIPVYEEICLALNYISSIQKLVQKYPPYFANYLGSRYRASSIENLINTQINSLKDRLNHRFFSLENQDEIDKTKMQIRFLELTLAEETKFFPELFNFTRIFIGLDATALGISEFDQKAIYQILSFLNGSKTQKEEYVKSAMIFLRMQSNMPNDVSNQELKLLSESILDIARYFFNNVFKEAKDNNTVRQNQLTYNQKYPLKAFHIKTIIDDTMIYTYTHKNSYNFLGELIVILFKSMFGEKNALQPLLPEAKTISDFQKLRNMLKFFKEINITKKDIKVLAYCLEHFPANLEQKKLPLNTRKN